MTSSSDTVFGLLHTPDGAPVYWDTAAQAVRYAGSPTRNLACMTNGQHAHLIVFDPASGGALGNLVAGADGMLRLAASGPAPWWEVVAGDGVVGLAAAGARLVWRADGAVGLGEAGDAGGDAAGGCWFWMVSTLTEACVRAIGSGAWIQANGAAVAPAEGAGARRALRLGGEVVRLGGVPGPFVVGEETAEGGAPRQLHAMGAQGRLHRLALFRPVICFSVFGADAYYEALGVALASLHRFGGYKGAVCVGADRPRAAVAAYVPEAYRDSWMHVDVAAEAGLFGRYGMADWGLEAFQPVLYLDVDVVANARLGPLLVQLALSPRVHVATEQEWERAFAGRVAGGLAESAEAAWFGGWLLAADPRFRGRVPAYGSSGVIGADHVSRLRVPFAMVQALRQVVEPARIAAYTDQALTNYALHVCNAGFGLLNGFVDFAHRPESVQAASGDPRRGLMHFHSGVGAGARKRDAMRAYVARLADVGGG